MAGKVKTLGLERDHKKFLDFLADGNGTQKGGSSDAEVVVRGHYLDFIERDGDISRSQRRSGDKRAV